MFEWDVSHGIDKLSAIGRDVQETGLHLFSLFETMKD
jgi:hypothetical protein